MDLFLVNLFLTVYLAKIFSKKMLKKGECKHDDILFSITTQENVAVKIIELSKLIPIILVVTYSNMVDSRIKELCGNTFENSINSTNYDVFPFGDNLYNSRIHWLTEKKV